METSLTESTVFLGCVYGGLCMGLLYEFFAFIALLWKKNWFHAVLDLLFCGLCMGLAALFLLYLNGGRPRLYGILGFFLGGILFRSGPGTLFRHLLCRIQKSFSHF